MIDVKELRIGNWVILTRKHYKVSLSGFKLAKNRYEPIPLTPEILEKCGFNRKSDNDNRHEWLWIEDFWMQFDYHHRDYVTYYPGWPDHDLSGYSTTVYHLHQLQNLYFALTKTELTYNP